MNDFDVDIAPYAAAVRKLLLGIVYYDEHKIWSQIRDYEFPIREYLGKLGLHMHLDEIGGFAFLRDMSRDADSSVYLPTLAQRRNLPFYDTLLLVLLRDRLDEHEMRDIDEARLFLSHDEILDMLTIFMGDYSDARKMEQVIRECVNRLTKYGFLKAHAGDRYEVRTVIRAKVDADVLLDIKTRLEQFMQNGEKTDINGDDESV